VQGGKQCAGRASSVRGGKQWAGRAEGDTTPLHMRVAPRTGLTLSGLSRVEMTRSRCSFFRKSMPAVAEVERGVSVSWRGHLPAEWCCLPEGTAASCL